MRSTIRLGSHGPDIGVLQRVLGITSDETFGPKTEVALKAWQASRGLFADGVAGPQVWTAAGEASSPTATLGASPAARAALRDANATWPDRNRASDGIMGDPRHVAAGKSSHNSGNAVDITNDPASGCAGEAVRRLALDDPRCVYVIHRARIWNNRLGDNPDGEGRPYRGSNPHHHHVHIDIDPTRREDSSPWPWATPLDAA